MWALGRVLSCSERVRKDACLLMNYECPRYILLMAYLLDVVKTAFTVIHLFLADVLMNCELLLMLI